MVGDLFNPLDMVSRVIMKGGDFALYSSVKGRRVEELSIGISLTEQKNSRFGFPKVLFTLKDKLEEQLNKNGEIFIKRYPHLKVKVVDRSSLIVAMVLNSILKGTSQVVLRGRLSKVDYNITLALCEWGIQVVMLNEEDNKRLKAKLTPEAATNLVFSKSYNVSKVVMFDEEDKKRLKAKLIPEAATNLVFSKSYNVSKRYPHLKVKVVDGSSLAVVVVLNSIPKGTSQVVLQGRLFKVANNIDLTLCEEIVMLDEEDKKRLKTKLTTEAATNLVFSKSYNMSKPIEPHLLWCFSVKIWMKKDFAQNDYEKEVILLFRSIMEEGFVSNEHSFSSVTSACSSVKNLKLGKEIHAWMLK
ncbi:hypothetical protein BC332_28204 [Capsicum chinense]|nr:hypothetical protein BC332_28204 [Capsicum chinense]